MPSKRIPHPPRRVPVIGDILGMSMTKPMQRVVEISRELGPIYQRIILGKHLVFVSGPDIVAEVNNDAVWGKFIGRPLQQFRPVTGDGLFTAHDDEPNWMKAHNILMPGFTQAAMRGYHSTMLETARELIDSWDHASEPLDVSDEMSKLTLETIGLAGFGYRFHSLTQRDEDPFVAAMMRALAFAQRGSLAVPGGHVLNWWTARQNRADIDYLFGVVREVIAARRAGTGEQGDDLLSLMLDGIDVDSGESLDEDNVIRQVLTFLVAGHETSSGALSFALWLLSTHPEVLARAREEVDGMWPGPDLPDVQFEEVAKLRYLRRVLDETLRLWPTAPGYYRQAKQDTTLAGYEFSRGDWVLVAVMQLHRDPTAWPDPETFDPDRFLPENIRARPAHAYKPFGTGLRACIGRQFAIHEIVMALALLVHRYDFTVEPGYELDVREQLTMKPHGLRVTVKRRDRSPISVS